MQIANDFPISLPPDQAYRLLLDLDRVAPCMPGAELGEALDDGSRAVTVKVKLGPMRFTYDGSVRVAEQDDAARRALLVGTAKEVRGQGTAEARITMTVSGADDGGSTVSTSADVDLTGRAAQMGHGVVTAVSAQLLKQMSDNLEASIAAGDAAVPGGGPAAAAAPQAAAQPRPAPARPAPPANNDLRAGKLLLAVLRSWVARLTRRGRKEPTR